MNWRDARAAFEPVPLHRISTEEMADDLMTDLMTIVDRIREYECDLAALQRLRETKASQLECCLRVLGRQP